MVRNRNRERYSSGHPGFWLALGTFSFLLTLQSGFDDTEAMVAIPIARALRSGHVYTEEKPTGNLFRGKDGRTYLVHDMLAPIVLVPIVALADWLPPPPGIPHPRFTLAACASVGAFYGAIAVFLFFRMIMAWGLTVERAGFYGLVALMGSMLLPYSRTGYDGLLSGLLVLGGMLMVVEQRPASWAGLFWGLACLARTSTVIMVVPLTSLFALRGLPGAKEVGRRVLRIFLGAVIPLALWLYFNYVRTGDALFPPARMARFENNQLDGNFWEGLFGNLLSPGTGIVFYCPLVFVGFWGLFKKRRFEAWLAFIAFAACLLFHAKIRNWSGHWAWGPRYLIPAIFLAVPGIALLGSFRGDRWVLRIVATVSLLIQLLPVMVSWQARIATSNVGAQDKAFSFEKSSIVDHAVTIGKWMGGEHPRMRKFPEANTGLDLWWLTWPDAYQVRWPFFVAVAMIFASALCLWQFSQLGRRSRETT